MGIGVLWTICLCAASNACRTLWISAPGWSSMATGSILTTRTAYGHALDDLNLGGTHSKQWHGVHWGPQRVRGLQFCLLALSVGTRLSEELWNSVNYVTSVYLLHWRCVPPETSSDCLLLCLQQVQHSAQHQVLSLGFSPVGNMHLHQWVACSDSYFLFQAAVAFHHSWVMDFSLMCNSQGDSIEDGSHCFQVQSSGNSAKYVCHCIIMPLLVF